MFTFNRILSLAGFLACLNSASAASDSCGQVAQAQHESIQSMSSAPLLPSDILFNTFDAKTAFDCATSIKLDKNNAIDTIKLLKDYFQFQTTLAYLKNPPGAYQQPAIDIMGRFDEMADKSSKGAYKSQYDFDVDLQSIAIDAHEEHFAAFTGILGIFQWLPEDSIISVSSDGQELPQVYASSDIKNKVNDASPIIEMGGKSVFEYIEDYMKRTSRISMIEPHAEWNMVMNNAAYQFGMWGSSAPSGDSKSYAPSYFEATLVYNGPSIKGRFANGTDFEWKYYAGSTSDLKSRGWTSGDKLYNDHIINQDLVSAIPTKSADVAISTAFYVPEQTEEVYIWNIYPRDEQSSLPTFTAVPDVGYPQDPDVIQEDLGVGGTVSGYLLENDLAVLSLPSFSSPVSTRTFSEAVYSFISKATKANSKKIVIDLSGNTGGSVFLGYDTFKQFFPSTEPSIMFRGRASAFTDTLGTLDTGMALAKSDNEEEQQVYDNVRTTYGSQSWICAAFTLDEQDEVYDSWSDFYGPISMKNDKFTNLGSYNLSGDEVVNDLGFFPAGYGNNTLSYDQAWDPDSIIILSDGACGSTCSLFSEMMKTDAGVKSVVIGGIPTYGPMQSVSGTRGGNTRRLEDISSLIKGMYEFIASSGSDASAIFRKFGVDLKDIWNLPVPFDYAAPWKLQGAVNTLDSYRRSSPKDPLHFTYEAADCRLFYTAEMVNDKRELWKAAAKFLDDDSVCVKGSLNGPGSKRNETVTDSPGFSGKDVWKHVNSSTVLAASTSGDEKAGGDDKDAGASLGPSIAGLAIAMLFALIV